MLCPVRVSYRGHASDRRTVMNALLSEGGTPLLPTALIFSVLCETRRRSTMCLGCDPLMAAFRRDPLKKSLLGSFQFLDRSGAQLAMWPCCFQSWPDTILGVRSPS